MAAERGLADGLNAFFFPVQLTLRALDDLNAVAEVTRRVEREGWIDRLSEQLAALVAVQRSAVEVQGRLAELETRLVEHVETLDERLPSTERIVAAVDELRESLGTLATSAEPIQGAAESIARVAERVPGAKRKRSE